MKVIKKYTPIILNTKTVNQTVEVGFEYGDKKGPYYDIIEPTEEFDTEEEAIEYAYNFDKYLRWIVVPLFKFED